MTSQLPIFRSVTVTRVTTLECAVCANGMYLDDFPDWTLPRTLWCPWCGTEQIYTKEKTTAYSKKEGDIPMDIINGSSLTTEREREAFAAIVRDFIERELSTAPRKKLHDIELVMRGWRPTADHRK